RRSPDGAQRNPGFILRNFATDAKPRTALRSIRAADYDPAYFGSSAFSLSMSRTFILKPPGITISPGFWSGLQAPSHLACSCIVVSRPAAPAAPPCACDEVFTV